MGKIFELIRPRSLTNSDYEEFEYLIRWIGRDGADYTYMFYDAEIEHKIDAEIINADNSNRIESLINSESRGIILSAIDLTRNDLTIIVQMLSNKFVTRLKKDGTIDRYATDSNSVKYRLMEGRYEIEFKLILSNLATWK